MDRRQTQIKIIMGIFNAVGTGVKARRKYSHLPSLFKEAYSEREILEARLTIHNKQPAMTQISIIAEL